MLNYSFLKVLRFDTQPQHVHVNALMQTLFQWHMNCI